MKSLSIILLLFSFVTFSYSQDKTENDSKKGSVEIEELPEIVLKKVGTDFSVYLPDKNPDGTVRVVEKKYIAYDLGKDIEGYKEYLLTLQVRNGFLAATYDENGKLTRVVENYKNVKLPREVVYSIYKTYPGWTIVNDKFLYTQKKGDIIKKQYQVKIKRNNETLKLIVKPNGTIVQEK